MAECIAEYCEVGFDRDAAALRSAAGVRVSIVSLLPSSHPVGSAHARVFEDFPRKEWFLWGFYFQALLDQALYSAARIDLARCEQPSPLKLGGILAAYHLNLHPALLLLAAATHYVTPDEVHRAIDEFAQLTQIQLDRAERVIARVSAERGVNEERVWSEMSTGVALAFLPRGLRPYSTARPNEALYRSWTELVARAVNTRGEAR
ncbi:hypothetical protein [Anaeromyxobacter sp. SG66]|uniref:hypothetical protein n=1 Tax=Anaeromyxobacter sp. SG66 TaxID=2925410 RepID=UPI001F58146D|nr:hypothetical protein [Anaeromyxobacter sp. SG66]